MNQSGRPPRRSERITAKAITANKNRLDRNKTVQRLGLSLQGAKNVNICEFREKGP